MKLYLSARASRVEELRGYAAQLTDLGHEIVSSWLYDLPIPVDDDDETPPDHSDMKDSGGLDPQHGGSDMSFEGGKPEPEPPNMRSTREILLADRAARIYTEILECDGFIAFTDSQNHTREASYAEYGGAVFRAANKQGRKRYVWIVGGRYHAVHYFSDVKTFPTFAEFLRMLQGHVALERQNEGQHKGG